MKNSFLDERVFSNDKSTKDPVYDSPDPVYATNGMLKGEIFLGWDSISTANKYVVQISKKNAAGTNNPAWEQVDIVTDPLCCITGLKPGKEYSFRVSAVYPDGISSWSSVVSKKVK